MKQELLERTIERPAQSTFETAVRTPVIANPAVFRRQERFWKEVRRGSLRRTRPSGMCSNASTDRNPL